MRVTATKTVDRPRALPSQRQGVRETETSRSAPSSTVGRAISRPLLPLGQSGLPRMNA